MTTKAGCGLSVPVWLAVAAAAAHQKTSPPDDAQAFRKAWLDTRRAALAKAGLDAPFE